MLVKLVIGSSLKDTKVSIFVCRYIYMVAMAHFANNNGNTLPQSILSLHALEIINTEQMASNCYFYK